MTFEEFFKKKKIDLVKLQTAEPALFAEFETHYAAMGEKSFDYTKKYWFNELRRKYHTPEEVKAEKVIIENQIAEQTVMDTLSNDLNEVPTPKLGFKPKFKAAAPPVENIPTPSEENKEAEPVAPAPKLGFKPKFKAAAPPKPAEESTPAPAEESKETEPTTPAPNLGFKPKFKAAAPPKPAEESTPDPAEENKDVEPTAPAPKLGFKPKFKAAAAPKPAEESSPAPAEENKETEPIAKPPLEEKKETEQPAPSAPKLGFKPKFKPQNIKPKTEGE